MMRITVLQWKPKSIRNTMARITYKMANPQLAEAASSKVGTFTVVGLLLLLLPEVKGAVVVTSKKRRMKWRKVES